MEKTYYGIQYEESYDNILFLETGEKKWDRTNGIPIEITGEENEIIEYEEDRFFAEHADWYWFDLESGELFIQRSETVHHVVWYSDPERTKEVKRYSVSEQDAFDYAYEEYLGADHIVGGEHCNTLTATRIGEQITDHGETKEKLDRTRERLFRDRAGRFFLETAHLKGRWPVWKNREFRFVDESEAKKWVQTYAPDALDGLFEIRENSEKVPFATGIQIETKEKLDRLASQTGLTTGELLDQIMSDCPRSIQ